MNWSNNLTIRAKVIGAFGLVLIVTCALGLFAMTKLSIVNDSTVEISSNYLAAQTQLGIINGAAMRFRQFDEIGTRQHAQDGEHAAGTGHAAFEHLVGIDQEILAHGGYGKRRQRAAAERQVVQ